eukprot:NODE_2666_length_456_cov_126.786241_g2205_i0.p1 GENE.NODE_2666_length_456_cov_126.786241_g2205_i0~~NODE_2666_length_456_cov_126.786241_g2205_i0.p1  ORF type:complete len:136 (-),score=8.79 NODE_2666_length_456_cov_126.786241_g2205_i0:49-435(-)
MGLLRWKCRKEVYLPHVTWHFVIISMFSMYPLVGKDHLYTAYIAMLLLCGIAYTRLPSCSTIVYIAQGVSVCGMVALHTLYALYTPPTRYPDIITLGITSYCCMHFVLLWVYYYVLQWGNILVDSRVD